MRHTLAAAVVACLTGCSNAPIAGFLDCVAPSQVERPNNTPVNPAPPPEAPLPPGELGPPIAPPVGPRP